MSVDLSVVVVTYRSAAFVSACLDAIPTGAGALTHEVIVVDNASDDGTAALVEEAHPGVRVVRSARNLGFARACNRGAREASGRHIALLNPDAICRSGALAEVVDVLERERGAGVAAPAVRNPDGTDQRTARSFPTGAALLFGRRSVLTRWFPANRWSERYLSPERPAGTGPYPVDWVSGACLVMPRATWDELGGLDEGYPMYWEDADVCRRAARLGRTTWCVPAAVVVHAEGSCGQRRSRHQIRWFHQGAYRYAARHELVGARAALRPIAAAALAARATALLASAAATPPTPTPPGRPRLPAVQRTTR